MVETLNQTDSRGFSFVQTCRNPDRLTQLYAALGKERRLAVNLARKSYVLLHLPKGRGNVELVGSFARKVSQ